MKKTLTTLIFCFVVVYGSFSRAEHHENERAAIDGVLDDDVWQEGATIGELVQAEPHPGEPAKQVPLALMACCNSSFPAVLMIWLT